jgi:hypothetical protein
MNKVFQEKFIFLLIYFHAGIQSTNLQEKKMQMTILDTKIEAQSEVKSG